MIFWALGSARWLQLCCTVIVGGSALFFLYGYSPRPAGGTDVDAAPSWPRWLLMTASAIGVASTLGWLSAEAAALAGTWDAWRAVVSGTRLGQVLVLRSGLLAVAFVACVLLGPKRPLWMIVSALGLLSVASFAWTGHGRIGLGGAARLHWCADVLHLLAAAVWIGALLPLSILITRSLGVASSTAQEWRTARALTRFSAIGPAVVALLLLSGIANSWFLLGRQPWRALLHSSYGLTLLAKVALFAVMLGLAALHRYRTAPALQYAIGQRLKPEPILRQLRTSMIVETVLAGLVIAAAAALGTMEPPSSI